MRFGLVGVGPWGKKIASKLVGLGHEIAYHSRGKGGPEKGLGEFLPSYESMPSEVDGVVLAATPEVVKEAAWFFAEDGKPVLATKPLLGAEDIMAAGHGDGIFMVDYVHLHSPLMKLLSDYIDTKKGEGVRVESVEAGFYGYGPVRGFSPLFDYGPHAVSAVFELLSTCLLDVKKVTVTSNHPGREFWDVHASVGGVETLLAVGNYQMSEENSSRVLVRFEDRQWAGYEEKWPDASFQASDRPTVKTSSHDPLGLLVKQFCTYVEDPTLKLDEDRRSDLELSSDVEDALNTIRRASASGR